MAEQHHHGSSDDHSSNDVYKLTFYAAFALNVAATAWSSSSFRSRRRRIGPRRSGPGPPSPPPPSSSGDGPVETKKKKNDVVSSNAYANKDRIHRILLYRTFLPVYLLAATADWLQGPYKYALYSSYGFTQTSIAYLFVAGYGSGMFLGSLVGGLADAWGRRRLAVVYCAAYGISCLMKHVKSFQALFVGRILGGIATSLLFSVFDAWLIAAHAARGLDRDVYLAKSLSAASYGSSVVAICAGLIANVVAENSGPLTPLLGFTKTASTGEARQAMMVTQSSSAGGAGVDDGGWGWVEDWLKMVGVGVRDVDAAAGGSALTAAEPTTSSAVLYVGGYTAAFDVALIPLCLCAALALLLWEENYGDNGVGEGGAVGGSGARGGPDHAVGGATSGGNAIGAVPGAGRQQRARLKAHASDVGDAVNDPTQRRPGGERGGGGGDDEERVVWMASGENVVGESSSSTGTHLHKRSAPKSAPIFGSSASSTTTAAVRENGVGQQGGRARSPPLPENCGGAVVVGTGEGSCNGGGGVMDDDERHRHHPPPGGMFGALRAASLTVWRSRDIFLCCVVSSLFEGSMYVFVFMWTPALTALRRTEGTADGNASDDDHSQLPFGWIFSTFMVCCMLGTTAFSRLSDAGVPAGRCLIAILALSSLSCLVIAWPSTGGGGKGMSLQYFGMLLYEGCIGAYFPAMGTVKGTLVPEHQRAAVYNVFRLPLNFIVLVNLLSDLTHVQSFGLCSAMLLVACMLQVRLCSSPLSSLNAKGGSLPREFEIEKGCTSDDLDR